MGVESSEEGDGQAASKEAVKQKVELRLSVQVTASLDLRLSPAPQ